MYHTLDVRIVHSFLMSALVWATQPLPNHASLPSTCVQLIGCHSCCIMQYQTEQPASTTTGLAPWGKLLTRTKPDLSRPSSSPSSAASPPSPYSDPGPISIGKTDLPISKFGARDPIQLVTPCHAVSGRGRAEYDDDEKLPGAELYRNSGSARPGIGSLSRGANSGVDANGTGYEVDAVYETSGRSHAAYCEVDALYETSITAAVLCGCCLGGFCPSLGFFPALLPFLSNPWEMWNVCTRKCDLLPFLFKPWGIWNVGTFFHVCTCVDCPATAKPCQPTCLASSMQLQLFVWHNSCSSQCSPSSASSTTTGLAP